MCVLPFLKKNTKKSSTFYDIEDSLQTKASPAHCHNHNPEKEINNNYMELSVCVMEKLQKHVVLQSWASSKQLAAVKTKINLEASLKL